MWPLLWHRLCASISLPLTPSDLLMTGLLLVVAAALILPAGLHIGFLRPVKAALTRSSAAGIAASAFVFPSMAEEILFRVLLLPHPLEEVSPVTTVLWAIAGTAAFVLYHPLKAPFAATKRAAVFTALMFLWMAFVVGGCCTAAYLSCGSIWPPVLLHWSVVVLWILYFGGYDLLFEKR
jgi:predicted Abi (CAAX) family protease